MDQIVERINFLYHKSQSEGLTEEERNEQQRLRRVYLDSIKGNLQSHLEHIGSEKSRKEKSKGCSCHSCNNGGKHHH
jgi:uncharacterized protein YnzC (UPF0291/DUF896 family)